MKSQIIMSAIGKVEDKYVLEAEPADAASAADTARAASATKAAGTTSTANNPADAAAAKSRPFRIWKFVPVAALLVLVVVLAAALGSNLSWFGGSGNNSAALPPDSAGKTSNSQASQQQAAASGQQADSAIRGLPVENFSLADVQEDSLAMSRVGFTDFGSFFRWGIDSIAVVRVEGIQTTSSGYSSPFDQRQISEVRVLQNIYGDCGSQSIQIYQSVIVDHFCLGTTNLLREGAVYILPLNRSDQGDGGWNATGDMDVLFEVDDNGMVWSHSGFEAFNEYDGKDLDSFIAAIQGLLSNDDFMLANSSFGDVLKSWTLADITIKAKSGALSDEFGQYYSYDFELNEVFSQPGYGQLKSSGSIMAYTDELDPTKLAAGNRYLIFLDYDGEKVHVNPQLIARVNDDSSIEAVPADRSRRFGGSVFAPYNGYKLAEMKELVTRIHSWNAAN